MRHTSAPVALLPVPSFRTLPILIAALFAVLPSTSCNPVESDSAMPADGHPQVLDDRLVLTLFAEHPDIVTPIGAAVDSLGRLYVLESHTAHRPQHYDGPESDHIKVFEDTNGDGRADKVTVFADGFEDGMNLAFSPEGTLYVVCARSVWVLYDRSGDGISDERKLIAKLVEPASVWAHAALLGVTFSHEGWMFISRGNTGGYHWILEGSDGSQVSGYGDGGNIIRARPDGSELSIYATGFWNAFDLTFDEQGRLLAADNDPDSRGPNRLLHIIEGGDYGYQALYGGSGIHPFLAWNGELPGTLPYAAALGEAPSGLLDASLAALPDDYRGSMLVTIWEELNIVRVPLVPSGVSVTGEAVPIVRADADFRPVALAASPDGSVYITDWVLRRYPNHGHGRIWRLASRPGTPTMAPRSHFAPPAEDPSAGALREIYSAMTQNRLPLLRDALASDDAFIRAAAIYVLGRPVFRSRLPALLEDTNGLVRMGAAVALMRSNEGGAERIVRQLLGDPDPEVRRVALIWAGSRTMTNLKDDLERSITVGPASPELFETYLAAVRHLEPAFAEAFRSRKHPRSSAIPRELPGGFLQRFIGDTSRFAALRAVAVAYLDDPTAHMDLLVGIARNESDAGLRTEAVRSLATVPHPDATSLLLEIARDQLLAEELRAEAILSLTHQPTDQTDVVISLLEDPSAAVQLEAVRYLHARGLPRAQPALNTRFEAVKDDPQLADVAAQIAIVLSGTENFESPYPRPADLEDWQEAAAEGGDAGIGRRVFYSIQSTCAQCHTVDGRGGDLGPDLTNAGLSKTRAQLVHSIIRPSDEVSPEWQGWYIKTADGRIHHGRQIDLGNNNDGELYTLAGVFESFTEIVEFGPLDRSLMPDGLERMLSVADMRHLLAFLEKEALK